MRMSCNWLKEYVDTGLSPQLLADRLTMAGLEVEGLEYLGEGLSGVIVGRIDDIRPHADADKLTICDVDTGSEVLPVVCGAKNMARGDKVPLALVGAALPDGVKIKKSKIRGVTSFGMLCSEKELGLAKESEGLLILPDDAQLGEDIVKAVGLDDWAMEVNVTPNRPDCLSAIGLAREAAALTRKELRLPPRNVPEHGKPVAELVSVDIKDPELCPRYAGRVVTGVKVGPSPSWLKMRLQSVGIRSINNVVDVTNFVMMEMGHPLHAFDYDLLEGHKIVVRGAGEGESFTTLDGVERALEPGMPLICDGMKPVALAGVMGGQNSEVTGGTKNLFLEAAYFDPAGIRRTSKKLGLRTEASFRFERGADPGGLIPALDRAASLIASIAGGKVAKGCADEYPEKITMPEIPVRVGRVNSILGADLIKSEVSDILVRLHMSIKDKGVDAFRVVPPTFRPDITREEDIVEEIARIYGYGRIKSELPAHEMLPALPDRTREASADVKDALIFCGYNEVINYSFIDPADFDRLMLPEDDYRRVVITLRNPLTTEQSVMRTTLVPSLMDNLAWNYSRGVRDLKLFELSRVFLTHGPGLPDEPLRVAGLACGRRTGRLWDGRDGSVDLFDIKGAVELVLDSLKVEGASYKSATDVPFLHPGKSAWLMLGGREAGFLGQVHPDVMERYDLPLSAYVFEIDLQALIDVGEGVPSFMPLPKFPAVERDVAVILPREVTSLSVMKVIESLKIDLMEDVRLFDFYEGMPIPEGKKSLAYTITYRSASRTLTDEEVNELHQSVIDALKERLGAQVRE